MSKQRSKRRTGREREAAIRAAARARAEERRERTAARKKPRRSVLKPRGGQTGVLARRRRVRSWLLVGFLLAVQVVVWVIWPEWEARLAALVLTVLVAPLLAGILLRRRR